MGTKAARGDVLGERAGWREVCRALRWVVMWVARVVFPRLGEGGLVRGYFFLD